ncbi:MAG: ATP-binding protein [Pseudomonadales bacterium]
MTAPIPVENARELLLKDQLRWRVDSARSPATIVEPFAPYQGETFANQPVWVSFAVSGTAHADAARYLQIDVPRVIEVSVWTRVIGSDWQPAMRHGVRGEIGLSVNSRPGVWLPQHEGPVDVALRIYDKVSFSPELRLFSATRLNGYSRSVVFAETIGFGVLLALALYACISLYVVRDKVYLFMAGYCLSSLVFVGHQAGYGMFLFGASYIDIKTTIIYSTPFFVYATFMALARDLVGFKKTWFIQSFIWGNAAVGLALALVWIEPLHRIPLAVSGLLSILVTPVVLVLALRGNRNARNFFIANLGSLFGGTYLLWSQVAGSGAADFSYAALLYGTSVTGLLVVLLLAMRYRDIKDQQAHLREQELHSRQVALENEAIAKAKSSFLATMSHEIRTPMNGVLGLASLLNETELEPMQRDYLRSIERSGKSLVAILDDILDYSKFEQSNVELEALEFDLVELVDDVVLGVQHRCKGKDLVLRTRFTASAPEFVIGDSTRLRQVLNNLIGNAIKFTEHGYVELSVWMEGAIIYFAVRDSGIGIPADQLPLLFERFQQADRSITREYGGTGLGLAISRLLVRAMGGEITVQSEMGVGSEFKASICVPQSQRCNTARMRSFAVSGLPDAVALAQDFADRWSVQLEQREESAANPLHCEWPLKLTHIRQIICEIAVEELQATDLDEPLAGLRILVAEDNQVNQVVIEKHLQNLGADVRVVENGKLAVGCAMSASFDLVLMDCEMPMMDGYTATRVLRESRDFTVPIIALTAHAGEEHRRQALDAGMDGYLTKPIGRAELINTILSHAVCSAPVDQGDESAPRP